MPIRLKLTVLLLAIGLIPIAFTSFLIFGRYRESIETARLAELSHLAELKADRLESYFEALENNLDIVRIGYAIRSSLPDLSSPAGAPDDRRRAAAQRMADQVLGKMPAIPGLRGVRLADLAGRTVYSSPAKLEAEELAIPLSEMRGSLASAGEPGIYFADSYAAPARGRSPTMLLAATVFDLDQRPAGFIAFIIDPAPLYAILQGAAGLGQSGEVLIGRREGAEIVFLNPRRFNSEATLRKRLTVGDRAGIPIQKATGGENGAGLLRDYRGKEVVAAWRYLPALGWGLVAKIDAEEAFADIRNLAKLTLGIGGIVLLLAGAIAFSAAQSISKPIRWLVRGAEIVGSGDLDHRVALARRDEIGQLSRAFDTMTEDLKRITAARDDLNQAIGERDRLTGVLNALLAEHRVILDSVPALIFFKDTENRFVRVNQAFEDALGVGRAELEGKSLFDLFPKERAEAYFKDDQEVMATGRAKRSIVEPMETRRGTRLVQTDKLPYFDEKGALRGIIGFAVDITERQQAQDALRRANERLELTHQGAEIGAWDWDLATGRLEWTRELFSLFGLDPAAAPATFELWRSLLHPEDRALAETRIDVALRDRVQLVNEYRVVRPNGEIRWIYALGRPILGADGRPARMTGICIDISDRKRAEEALQKAHDKLESQVKERTKQLNESVARLAVERQRFNDILDKLPVYVVTLTPDYHVSFANRYFRERFGESFGRRCYEYLFQRAEPCLNCETYKVLQAGTNREWEWTGPDRRDYHVFDFLFADVDGSPLILEMGLDVTDRKRSEAEVSEYRQRLEELVKDRTAQLEASNSRLRGEIVERRQAEENLRETRDYLESLFTYANAPIICWDTRLKITRFNPAFVNLSGRRAEDVIGRDLSILFPKASREESLDKIRRTLSERWEVVEIPILRADGEVRIALWNSANVYAEDGRTVLATIAQGQDITERQKSQETLQTLNRTLRALSDCNQALIRAADEPEYLGTVCRIIVEVCGYAMSWVGFPEHDGGKTVRPVASAGDTGGYLAAARFSWADTDRGRGPSGAAIRLGQVTFCQNMLTDSDFEPWRREATKRGYAASIALPLNSRDGILGALSIYSREANPFLDEEVKLLKELAAGISEGIMTIRLRAVRARAEEILRRDKATLEKLVERRSRELIVSQEELAKTRRLSDIGALAATVAHELRNPLAAIAFAAANIKRKAANPALAGNIRTIKKKVAESDQIIDNLLFYSRLRPPRLESVSLSRLIQESVQAARARFKKGVSLKIDLASLHEFPLQADPLQLKEVFSNILSNANEALESGEGIVEIRGRAATDSVSVSFTDNGPGMDPETLERAFSPFFTTKVKGTGLGLAICQSIVQMHGGSIAIESAPGRGTTVTVVLPRKTGS